MQTQAAQEHLWRADTYRLLALGFSPRDAENEATMHEVFTDLAGSGNDDVHDHLLQSVAKHLREGDEVYAEAEFNRLFVNQVHCSANEGSYQMAELGTVIGDISAFYQAFGVRVSEQHGSPDALAMELGFMAVMALKSAYAAEQQDAEALEVLMDAQKKFLNDHLARWADLFATKLLVMTDELFYQSLAHLLKYWTEQETKLFEIKPNKLTVSLPQYEGGLKCAM